MIDFEHCFYNLYLFDIANYFVEFAGLGSSPDWESEYPTKERRKAFLVEYLEHVRFLSHQGSEDETDKLSDQCYRLVVLSLISTGHCGRCWKPYSIPKHSLHSITLPMPRVVSINTNCTRTISSLRE